MYSVFLLFTLKVSTVHSCEPYLEAGPENGWMGSQLAGSCVPPNPPPQSVTPKLALASPQKVSVKFWKQGQQNFSEVVNIFTY